MRITLCGSSRFEPHFHDWEEQLTLSSHVVYGLAVYPSYKGSNKNWYTPIQKQQLDQVHCAKIDNSDIIVVINIGKYIGESTQREIVWADVTGKRVYYVEPSPLDYDAHELLTKELTPQSA